MPEVNIPVTKGKATVAIDTDKLPDHVYAGPLTELISHAFGPRSVIGEEFASLPGEPSVAIFGSWAARYLQQHGPPPHDLDVLVVGRPAREAVYDAADRAQHRPGAARRRAARDGAGPQS